MSIDERLVCSKHQAQFQQHARLFVQHDQATNHDAKAHLLCVFACGMSSPPDSAELTRKRM